MTYMIHINTWGVYEFYDPETKQTYQRHQAGEDIVRWKVYDADTQAFIRTQARAELENSYQKALFDLAYEQATAKTEIEPVDQICTPNHDKGTES